MLVHTFCHLPGVGPKTEQRLWTAGMTCWEALLATGSYSPVRVRDGWRRHLDDSLSRHAAGDADHFGRTLPAHAVWRLYRDFRDACAFVDIETTGLSHDARITTIALCDGRTVRTYVRGRNLQAFADDVRECRLLVTYNGKCFDVPVLERQLRIKLPLAHIDLRYVLRSLGLAGGLKACERALGLSRPGMEDLDGFAAVLLWEDYCRGSEAALETLLAYNAQDVVTLQTLVVHAFNAKVAATPFAEAMQLPSSPPPAVPHRADPAAMQRVRGLCDAAVWG